MKHGVKICYRNKEGRFLLLHRDEKAPSSPLMWTLVGGGVKHGESPEAAAIRESNEEVGHTPEKLTIITTAHTTKDVIGFPEKVELKFTLFYADIDKSLDQLTLGEGDGMEFFTFEEANNLPVCPLARACLDLARNFIEDSQTKSL